MSTWTPNTKTNEVTATPVTKNAVTMTPLTKAPQSAAGGLYYGFGAFTYSGGQSVTGPSVFTPLAKS